MAEMEVAQVVDQKVEEVQHPIQWVEAEED